MPSDKSYMYDLEQQHTVKDEIQGGVPSRRAAATLTAYGDHLWLIGGGMSIEQLRRTKL
jgi:hypothetical protein